MTDRPTGCQKIILATHIPNGLPVLQDLLEFFVSAQNCALPTLSDFFKIKKHTKNQNLKYFTCNLCSAQAL
jgi:hypothetical protein